MKPKIDIMKSNDGKKDLFVFHCVVLLTPDGEMVECLEYSNAHQKHINTGAVLLHKSTPCYDNVDVLSEVKRVIKNTYDYGYVESRKIKNLFSDFIEKQE